MLRSYSVLFLLVACSSSSTNPVDNPGGGKGGTHSGGSQSGGTGGSGGKPTTGGTGGSGGSTGGVAGASGVAGAAGAPAPTLICPPSITYDPLGSTVTYCGPEDCIYIDVECFPGASLGDNAEQGDAGCWSISTFACGSPSHVVVSTLGTGPGCNDTKTQIAECTS